MMKQLTAILILAAIAGGAAAQDAAQPDIRAGAAAVDITPQKFPVSMTGSFQDRQATSALDLLHARCVVLDDGASRVAIVVCDSCLIPRDIFDEAKQRASAKTNIPTSQMMMSATHTHTAPTAAPLAQCHPDADYLEYLTAQIAQAVVEANERLEAAQVGWAVGSEPREVGNRRWRVKPEGIVANPFGRIDDVVRTNPPRGSDLLIEPAGPIDPEVAILSLQSTGGESIALLANYSLHYVGGIPAGQLSADYFGEFARRIGEKLNAGSAFVGIMSNGTSGDVNNYNFKQPRPRAPAFERVDAVAERIAEVAHQSHKSVRHSSDVRLAMIERTIDLSVRRPNEVELQRAKDLLARAANPDRLNTDELYAQETVRLAASPPSVNIKLQALRIGELGIVAVPCEAFAEIGLDIKQRSPLKPTFVVTLANGYNGYLPTPRQHALGGYETWRSGWSYLDVDASTKITDALLAMLAEIED